MSITGPGSVTAMNIAAVTNMNNQIIGVNFAGGMSGVVSALNSAFGSTLQFSASGTTLQVVNAASTSNTVNSLTATSTATSDERQRAASAVS